MTKDDIKELAENLQASIRVNNAFDYLIDLIVSAFEECSACRVTQIFDEMYMNKVINTLELCITASDNDERVIRICRVLKDFAGIDDSELRIHCNGSIDRRKVYFVQRSDGTIKVGSSMNVKNRILGLQTGAGEKLKLIFEMNGTTHDEKNLHKLFEKDHVYGEWFHPLNILNFINIMMLEDNPSI